MSTFLHSIRWRVQVWHGTILLGAVLAFCLTAYRLAWDTQLRRIDTALIQNEHQLMRGLMEAGRPPAGPPEPFSPEQLVARLRQGTASLPAGVAELFHGREPGYAYFSLFGPDASVLLRSENAPAGLRPLPYPVKDFDEALRTVGQRREMLRSSAQGLGSLVGCDITPELEGMRRFAWSLGAAGLGVWLLGLLGGWWLAGRAIQPIAAISHTATRIAAGNLDERIGTTGSDSELDQLGRVLNETFDRLHAVFEQQKQFTADASHELRTPVTILLTETQRILKRERTPAEYREAVQTCHDTAERMRRLIEALLLLSRQEAAGAQAPREACDLAAIVGETLAQLGPLAAGRNIRLHADLRAAPCVADAAALAILTSNLLANAIQHHHDGGSVEVTCAAGGRGVIFSVRDDGPGIPAGDQPHIFRRFYRVDKVRTGSTGHTGLGLAIAKAIVDNHGGTIRVESRPGEGACFTVELPGATATAGGRSS